LADRLRWYLVLRSCGRSLSAADRLYIRRTRGAQTHASGSKNIPIDPRTCTCICGDVLVSSLLGDTKIKPMMRQMITRSASWCRMAGLFQRIAPLGRQLRAPCGSIRPAAVLKRIEVPDTRHSLPHSDQLQCGPELQGGCTRHWPGVDRGQRCSIAAIRKNEFSIRVVKPLPNPSTIVGERHRSGSGWKSVIWCS
jgi:hypothetical protein